MNSVEIKKEFTYTDYDTAEAIKTLRTNILFSGTDIKSVCFTSCMSGDGKSSVSLNLAIAMAQSGKRVLFVDLDLRKSVLVNRVNIEDNSVIIGMSSYLAGLSKLGDIVYKTNIPMLHMVFAGKHVSNPTEMLGSEKFRQFIDASKETFDFIVIDSAPLGQVIDCSILCPLVDGVAIVVNQQKNSYHFVKKIAYQIEKSNGKVLGVVLNKVKDISGYGHYGQYGQYGKYGKYGKY